MTKPAQFVFQVAEIKYAKEGYHIVRTTGGDSVSGKFQAKEGYCYKAEGAWETHPIYGPQYKLESAVMIKMTSPEALGRFLVYQMRGKGVGEAVIGMVVEACKADKLDLEELLDKGERDILVECVGSRNAKKIDLILAVWPKIKPAADLMSPLLGYGLSEAISETLISLYGKNALTVVETDPYSLIQRVDGISFHKADAIAMKVGIIRKTDGKRLRAALSTGMREATGNGDIGVRRKTLIDKTMPMVNDAIIENGRRKLNPDVIPVVSADLLAQVLDDMIKGIAKDDDGSSCEFSSKLVEFPDEKGERVVWYAPLIEAEKTIARRLACLKAPPRPDLVAKIDEVAKSLGAELAPHQRAAIEMVLMNPVSVVTGGPGVGKSFMQKVLLAVLDLARQRGSLAAPTGKAAKRITESTKRPASTQHSLIGFGAGGRTMFNEACPLVADYLILDEASMSDTELTAATLAAVPNNCRVVLIGDVDQLPSVGPGQVLRDLIRSETVPVTRLTKGFRFSGGIAEAARAINRGEMPESTDDGQYVFVESETPHQDLAEAVKALLASGANPDDIQVLAPTHRGDAGCTSLNLIMQSIFNPEPAGVKSAQRLRRDSGDIRVGDRVIQNKNDREIGLVNGDIGWIDDISSDKGSVELTLPDKDKPLKMASNQTLNLKLAYAITVHKSQGAEAPFILLALDRSASFMLRRELVYTGVTRGSKRVMVFASRSTMSRAVKMGQPPEGTRRTSLVSKLHSALPRIASAKPVEPVDPLAAAMLAGGSMDADI